MIPFLPYYLTTNGNIHLPNLEIFINNLAVVENVLYKNLFRDSLYKDLEVIIYYFIIIFSFFVFK